MAELSAHQQSTVDASEQWFTLDNRHGPIWGSRGREFKSRQPDRRFPLLTRDHEPITVYTSARIGPLTATMTATRGDDCNAYAVTVKVPRIPGTCPSSAVERSAPRCWPSARQSRVLT
jgi:hypothetical protein